eukprot:4998924-Ditylum_brightwellii.AAC.1
MLVLSKDKVCGSTSIPANCIAKTSGKVKAQSQFVYALLALSMDLCINTNDHRKCQEVCAVILGELEMQGHCDGGRELVNLTYGSTNIYQVPL